MPIYNYEALKNGKEVVKGEVTASDLKDARDIIRKMGLVPTKINETSTNKSNANSSRVSILYFTQPIRVKIISSRL